MKKNPLNDKDFLKALDLVKKKETYIKIHSLSFDEQIQETIEGKILSGSINIDGDSSVRRTCSLSMIAEDIDLNNYFWTINTKIKIFIGIENTINSNYDDIIWFKQGIFVLTNFNVTYNTNSYTINLSGQDKMCLLNGTIGGALPASIDFKQQVINTKIYEEVDLGSKFIPELFQIAKDSVMILDTSENFSSDKMYYKKTFSQFQAVSDIALNDYQQGQYFIENPELFVDVLDYFSSVNFNTPQSIFDYCQKEKIYIYTKEEEQSTINSEEIDPENEVIEDNSISYSIADFTNLESIQTIKRDQFFISQEFIKIDSSVNFEDFLHYYIKNTTSNKMEEILLDETMFTEQKDQLYIDNSYVLADEYDKDIQYYILQEGQYEKIDLNMFSYKANKYYYKEILTYESVSNSAFNPDEIYYDLDGNYVDFYAKAYYSYQSNKYYVKNIYEDDFILYSGEYDPTLTYYEQKVYSDKEDVPIKVIIKEAVHTYGREPYYNIIINDVDDEGLLLKEYIGDEPLYLLVNNGVCENITNGSQECYVINGTIDNQAISLYSSLLQEELKTLNQQYVQQEIDLEELQQAKENIKQLLVSSLNASQTTIDDKDTIVYNTFIEDFDKNPSKIFFINENTTEIKIYTVLKLTKGDAAGYELTDLTYPYDLISSPGEALTSILDKIRDTLSNFEYFYDIDGHFVFQRKKTYLNVSWNNIITTDDQTYVTSAADTSATQYNFENNDLIISIGNSVKLDNLKNDYSIWGTRKTINGAEVPIHARFAIDEKPYAYVTFPRSKYNYVDKSDNLEIEVINDLKYLHQDIYVNKDYYADILNLDYAYDEDEEEESFDMVRINPTLYKGTMFAGIYYRYIICDWREIIYQMALDYYKHNQENDFLANLSNYNTFDTSDDYYEGNEFMDIINRNAGRLYPTGVTGYEQYYEDMEAFWRELYNPNPEVDLGYNGGYYVNKEWQELITDYSNFNCEYYLPESEYDKYLDLLNQAIEDIEDKIEKLKAELEKYETDQDLIDLLQSIEELNNGPDGLVELQKQKAALLKSYYTQQLFAFNDPEYRKMQQEYSNIEQDRDSLIAKTEAKILSILKDSFELY